MQTKRKICPSIHSTQEIFLCNSLAGLVPYLLNFGGQREVREELAAVSFLPHGELLLYSFWLGGFCVPELFMYRGVVVKKSLFCYWQCFFMFILR